MRDGAWGWGFSPAVWRASTRSASRLSSSPRTRLTTLATNGSASPPVAPLSLAKTGPASPRCGATRPETPPRSLGQSSELGQLLFQLEDGREEVTVLLDPLQHVAGLEDQRRAVAGVGALLDLVPGQRRRAGRTGAGAQRVDGDRRFAAVVLGPVDEDLVLTFDLFHFRDDLAGRL